MTNTIGTYSGASVTRVKKKKKKDHRLFRFHPFHLWVRYPFFLTLRCICGTKVTGFFAR